MNPAAPGRAPAFGATALAHFGSTALGALRRTPGALGAFFSAPAHAVPLEHGAPPGAPTTTAIDDCDDLFAAVHERLDRAVADWFAAPPEASSRHDVLQAHQGVLDCIDALTQLHATLMVEAQRHRRVGAGAAGRGPAFDTEATAAHPATPDGPTALANSRCFAAHLGRVLAQAAPEQRPVAVLYLDIDDFKPVNELHGTEVGDALLRIIAARLARAIRAVDRASRVGGDEFACVVAGFSNREDLSHLACKLLDAVAAPARIGSLRLEVRPSIGIAMWPADGTTPEALIHGADEAMQRAKRQKCGYAFFSERADTWMHQAT